MRNLYRPIVILLVMVGTARADEIRVAAGESVQKAIDAAPAGAVISLAEGVYPEHLFIARPLTLQGAGWQRTILRSGAQTRQRSDEERLKFVHQLESATSREQQMRIVAEYLNYINKPTITIQAVRGVVLRGIKVQGEPPRDVDGLTNDVLVRFDDSQGQVTDCAIIGPFMNGIEVTNGSDVEIRHSLVAGMWGTGVAVHRGESGRNPAKLRLLDSDIRNCYHRCVTISGEGSTVEKCWISGSAWHGIRYDNASPTIAGNRIFGNARSGIYASGRTSAKVQDNVFHRNEMDGMSCWFNNADTVERNTFVDNQREAIAVLGDSKPSLVRNIISGSPVGVMLGQIGSGGGARGSPEPKIEGNCFWNNPVPLKRLDRDEPVPPGNVEMQPRFLDAAKGDFGVPADAQAGASALLPAKSPFPLQPEEQEMIPETETRDFGKWKKPGKTSG